MNRALQPCADIDERAWASLYSTVSRPFAPPETGRIAVKVINHYGDEVLKVYDVASSAPSSQLGRNQSGPSLSRRGLRNKLGPVRVSFWGVRGSVPWATAGSIGHGCNTPCIEVADEQSGRRLIFDAGSGIVGLGAEIDAAPGISIVLTHYHWDHVQGLPFFAPLYRPGCTVTVWAPALGRQSADLGMMFGPPFFPVRCDRLPSPPDIRVNGAAQLEIDGFQVSAQPLNHPGGSLAYRIGAPGADIVYATDHEFGNAGIDRDLANFCRGARALILDSHFTPDEMPAHKGWGHSDWSQCARFAADCGAHRLWLFHHKPGRRDDEMTAIEHAAQRIFAETGAAKEGQSFLV